MQGTSMQELHAKKKRFVRCKGQCNRFIHVRESEELEIHLCVDCERRIKAQLESRKHVRD